MFEGEPPPDVTERVLASTSVTTYGYIYDGGQLRQMTITTTVTADEETTTQAETLSFTYDASGAPQTVTCGNTTYLYVTNLQGDVVAILDSTGNPLMEYTYDAWGKLLTTNSSMEGHVVEYNPLRYRGYVYDAETGFYYLQSRYYDPELGRFLNADALVSTGQGLLGNNMFAYCRNNPVRRKDVSGTTAVEIFDDDASLVDGDKEIDGTKIGGGGGGTSRCPNPDGRKGGEAHRSMIQKIKIQLERLGFEVSEEHRVNTPGGYKNVRYVDLYASNGQDAFGVQVGRMTQGGMPVARECRALGDLACANLYVVFVAYK